jgi:GH15 family glucan-1,4-alpha-glucosidase
VEFDAAKLDAPIGQEKLADHWRERAEGLEEWVCELLRKNQTLRMALENEPCPRQECVDIRESVKRLMMRWGSY